MSKIRRFFSLALAFFLLFGVFVSPAKAEELPEGIVVADSNGISVDSQTGEFFVLVDKMMPGETYTKYITIQNLREDEAFQIFMRMEPLTQSGNYNLFDHVLLKLTMGGQLIYQGSPDGIGNINMQNTAAPLGDVYKPGDIRQLKLEVILPGDQIENGEYGAVTFRWIFSAHLDEDYTPPVTGIIVSTVLYTVIAMLSLILLIVCILCKRTGKTWKQIFSEEQES